MKILIIKLGAGGDVLRTTSILPSLVEKYPQAHISWLVREKFCEILKGNPFIDRVEGKEWKKEEKLSAVLAGIKGRPISEICRQYGVSRGQYYKWRK